MSKSEIYEILNNVYECIYDLEVIINEIQIYHKEEYENYHKEINSYIGDKNETETKTQ